MLKLTKGNSETILAVCDTIDEAIEEGEEFRKHLTMDAGILSVIRTNVDENNNRKGNSYRLYHAWV